MSRQPPFFIALDGMTRLRALWLVQRLVTSRHAHLIAGFKIHDLWDTFGPSIVRDLKRAGAPRVWVDLKLHDTPNTILLRTQAIKRAGANIVSVHAGSGVRGLAAAKQSGLKVVAITLLTSLDRNDARTLYGSPTNMLVLRLANAAKMAGVWGLVCSKEEIGTVKNTKLRIIVPGIRFDKAGDDNQRRTGTPEDALRRGAHYLVLGSILTKAKDPLKVFEAIALSTAS